MPYLKGNRVNIEKLQAAGFVETTYEGQSGVFYTKRMPLSEMPYYRENVVDNDLYLETDVAIIECCTTDKFPDGGVQMTIDGLDYLEDMVGIDSEEGTSLLRQAGLHFDGLFHPLGSGEYQS